MDFLSHCLFYKNEGAADCVHLAWCLYNATINVRMTKHKIVTYRAHNPIKILQRHEAEAQHQYQATFKIHSTQLLPLLMAFLACAATKIK